MYKEHCLLPLTEEVICEPIHQTKHCLISLQETFRFDNNKHFLTLEFLTPTLRGI